MIALCHMYSLFDCNTHLINIKTSSNTAEIDNGTYGASLKFSKKNSKTDRPTDWPTDNTTYKDASRRLKND